MSNLVVSRRKGETVVINGNIKVSVVEIHGKQVRLAFDAPRDMLIFREELLQNPTNNRPEE